MIRLSKQEDREGLIALWQEAFGDSREAVEIFLNSRYNPQNTLVCEENKKIASMLFLLDGKVKTDDVTLNAYYLYAAATLKEFRGRGIMGQMLDEAEKLVQSRGVDLICLKPAEDSLYGYYARFGYKTLFKTKKASLKVPVNACLLSLCGNPELFTVREAAFGSFGRFVWDNDAIIYAAEQHKYYGGKLYCDCNGYCLYSIENEICYVKELAFTHCELHQVLSKIACLEEISEFRVELPVDFPIDSEDCSLNDNGMALLISGKAVLLENKTDLYLNLTLD